MRVRQFKIRVNQASHIKYAIKDWTNFWITSNKSLWKHCLHAEINFFRLTRLQTDRANIQYGNMSVSFLSNYTRVEHFSFSYLYTNLPIKKRKSYELWTLATHLSKLYKRSGKFKYIAINKNNKHQFIEPSRYSRQVRLRLQFLYREMRVWRGLKFFISSEWKRWKKGSRKYRRVLNYFNRYEQVEVNRIVYNKAPNYYFHPYYSYYYTKYKTYKFKDFFSKKIMYPIINTPASSAYLSLIATSLVRSKATKYPHLLKPKKHTPKIQRKLHKMFSKYIKLLRLVKRNNLTTNQAQNFKIKIHQKVNSAFHKYIRELYSKSTTLSTKQTQNMKLKFYRKAFKLHLQHQKILGGKNISKRKVVSQLKQKNKKIVISKKSLRRFTSTARTWLIHCRRIKKVRFIPIWRRRRIPRRSTKTHLNRLIHYNIKNTNTDKFYKPLTHSYILLKLTKKSSLPGLNYQKYSLKVIK